MNKKQANEIIVSLSNPSKMPCKGYSIPAQECKTGSKLRTVPGSVCFDCYAMKGCYGFSNVKKTLYKRFDSIVKPQWVGAMVAAIGKDAFFRWHDSGDIQNIEHLESIIDVIEKTPHCMHWIPTKEKKLINAFFRSGGKLPSNVSLRLSGAMVDDKPPKTNGRYNTSTVYTSRKNIVGFECKAYRTKKNGEQITFAQYSKLSKTEKKDFGYCGNCRSCWKKEIKNISYPKH